MGKQDIPPVDWPQPNKMGAQIFYTMKESACLILLERLEVPSTIESIENQKFHGQTLYLFPLA